MSSRAKNKAAARQARLAKEQESLAAAQGRRRLRVLAGVVATAAAVAALAIAISSGGGAANAASGRRLIGAAFSASLFSGIPQHGLRLGRSNAPVKVVEFADLQCPYCDAYSVDALPTLVRDYVRTGKVQMQFENLAFIGPGSVAAGQAAAAAAQQNRLWNYLDLMYLNQGEENSGYVTPTYIRRLLDAVPGLNVPIALKASQAPGADAYLSNANQNAARAGINETPSFLIGRAGGPLQRFQPTTLSPAPFEAEFNHLLAGTP